jgi:hypothetical protein
MVSLFLITGCTTSPTVPKIQTFEDVNVSDSIHASDAKTVDLINSFLFYWHARQNGDTNTSYYYELPYQKYVTPYEKYKKLISGLYYGVRTELNRISFQHNNNIAIITRKVYVSKGVSFPKKDKWIYYGNRWYHRFFQTVLPPKSAEEVEFQ